MTEVSQLDGAEATEQPKPCLYRVEDGHLSGLPFICTLDKGHEGEHNEAIEAIEAPTFSCPIPWCVAPADWHDPEECPSIHHSPNFGVMEDRVTYNPDGGDPEDVWALDLQGGRFWGEDAATLAAELRDYAAGILQAVEWLEGRR